MTKLRMRTTIGVALVALGSVLAACVPQAPTTPGPCVDGWKQIFEAPVADTHPPTVPDAPYLGNIGSAALSGNGRYLALGATPATSAITVRDLVTGVIEAAPGSTYLDRAPLISADGSVVAFERYTLPTNSIDPPRSTVVWNRVTGAVDTVTAAADSQPIDMTPDGASVLVRVDSFDIHDPSWTIVFDTPTATATRLDLSSIVPDSFTRPTAMSDDARNIALTVTSRSDYSRTTGIFHRDSGRLTPLANGYIEALDGDGQIAAVVNDGSPYSGSIWHVATNTLSQLGADLPLAINRAGTSAIVMQWPVGPLPAAVPVSSLDLATGQHHLISGSASLFSPNFGVSGSADFDRVVVVETSPNRAVVKQRC